MSEGYLTTAQVAKLHGVTRGCVVQWIKQDTDPLPAEKFNQVWMIKEIDARMFQRRPITGRPRR